MTEYSTLNQISISCIDLVISDHWFREGIGLAPDGGAVLPAGMPFAEGLLDAPDAEAIRWWLKGSDPTVRIALQQFSLPLPRLLPAEHTPADPGWSRIGFYVADFDGTLARLAGLASKPVGEIAGVAGERRACVRSPDGLYVELMEKDPLAASVGEAGVALRYITLTTSDLAAAGDYLQGLTGVAPADLTLHDDADEALWGLAGVRAQRQVFRSGEVLIELAKYTGAPVAEKLDDWRLSDQGIANVRFVARSREAVLTRIGAESADVAGPITFLAAPGGASVELAGDDAPIGETDGERPSPYRHHVKQTVLIDAPYDQVWALLNEHDGMDRWIEADEFHIVRHGSPYSAGYGAERLLIAMGRRVGQQVTLVRDGRIGYRAISGTPFAYHNGAIYVAETGGQVKLDWTIRYQTRDAAIGEQVFPQLSAGIGHMLNIVKAIVEDEKAD